MYHISIGFFCFVFFLFRESADMQCPENKKRSHDGEEIKTQMKKKHTYVRRRGSGRRSWGICSGDSYSYRVTTVCLRDVQCVSVCLHVYCTCEDRGGRRHILPRWGGGWQVGFTSDELSSIQSGEAKPLSARCAGRRITKKTPGRFQHFHQPSRFFVSEEGLQASRSPN